jgi:hypothetical protein
MFCSKPAATISFASIVHGRDASVRITDDGLADVVDTVMVVTGKNCNHSNELLRNLKPSLFDNENFVMRSGRRYLSLRDTITLIMVLPGKMATELRRKFADIIKQHIELQNDPDTGKTSVHINSDTVEVTEARCKRIKREDLELAKLELEIDEKRANVLLRLQEVQEKRIKNFKDSMALVSEFNPSWQKTPGRFRMQANDIAKNILITPVTAARITNGEQSEVEKRQMPLSISQLALELGCGQLSHDNLTKAGKIAASLFRIKYGHEPSKHLQYVHGAERNVNSYIEADRHILTQALTKMGLAKQEDAVNARG